MAKFLWHGSYSEAGAKGLISDGATKRRADVERAFSGAGGTLEALYWAFGEDDYYLIVDFPDKVSEAAVNLATNAAGLVRVKSVALMTAEEVDEATKRSGSYTVPGT
jgi:uncharacterized protein with GYD domain